ncbi:MAG: hypothetical protein AB1598_03365 [Thermodesulfobacteriota bacterium]
MKKTIILAVAALSLAFFTTASNSYADRDATPYEAAMIYGALEAQGCTVTDDIEVEPFKGYYGYRKPNGLLPGIYKTEAVCYDGEKYDIKMDSNLNIISKEED